MLKMLNFKNYIIAGVLVQACFLVFTNVVAQPAEPRQAINQDKISYIGILAFRGADAAVTYWQPLADYLTKSIAGRQFKLTPVTLVSAFQHIESKSIDFIITNPGHYVKLAEQFALSAMSTRERVRVDGKENLLEYGSAIIVRKDSEILAINGLKNMTVAAVSPDAFGGFQIAWNEMRAQGVDAFSDLKGIRFMGFPQDDIFSAVLNGEVDAGIVRSGLLEMLAAEGQLKFGAFRVLNANNQIDYPNRISSRLYPEWPFASLPGIDKSLKVSVLQSLLNSQDTRIASVHRLSDIWAAPLSYEQVRQLTSAYQDRLDKTNGVRFSNFELNIVYFVLGGILLSAATVIYLFNRRQKTSVPATVQPISAEQKLALKDVDDKFQMLTPREREILVMVCSGSASKDIAEKLNISTKTVEFHRTNLLRKTQTGTTAHLVQMATRLGIDQGYPPV